MNFDFWVWVGIAILMVGTILYLFGSNNKEEKIRKIGGNILIAASVLVFVLNGFRSVQTLPDRTFVICPYCEEEVKITNFCGECGGQLNFSYSEKEKK